MMPEFGNWFNAAERRERQMEVLRGRKILAPQLFFYRRVVTGEGSE